MNNHHILRGTAAVLALLTAGAASAHTGHGVSGVADGLAHPLGADHLLAMLAVGAWSAAGAGTPRYWLGPLSFLVAMGAGAWLGLAGLRSPLVEPGLALSVVLLGGMLALSSRLPTGPGLALVALAASMHGLAHGAELPAGASVAGYATGFLLTTAALQIGGAGLVLALRPSGARVWQMLGASFGMAGLMLLLRA